MQMVAVPGTPSSNSIGDGVMDTLYVSLASAAVLSSTRGSRMVLDDLTAVVVSKTTKLESKDGPEATISV